MADEFTPTTEQVRGQIQDGVLSTGAIDGEAFDRFVESVRAEQREKDARVVRSILAGSLGAKIAAVIRAGGAA